MPGGPPGDAYASIWTRDDPRFTRADADLWHDLHIQAPDAALGVTAAVPVPEGQARVRVPPRTQPGSVLRVEGRGPPRYGGYGRSSLNLTVILDIPRQLSARQRQLYEQLRAEDAGRTSTAGGSREPDAPRSGRRITADAGGRHAGSRRRAAVPAARQNHPGHHAWSRVPYRARSARSIVMAVPAVAWRAAGGGPRRAGQLRGTAGRPRPRADLR